jgi:hypothetical protein
MIFEPGSEMKSPMAEEEAVHVSCIDWGKPTLRISSDISDGVLGVEGPLSTLYASERDGTKGGKIMISRGMVGV